MCVSDRYGASIYVTMTDVGQYCVSVTDVGPVQCVSEECGASTYVAMKDWGTTVRQRQIWGQYCVLVTDVVQYSVSATDVGQYCVSVTDMGPVLCVSDRCGAITVCQ